MITNILSDPNAKLFTYGPNTPLILHQNGDDPKAPLWPAASKTAPPTTTAIHGPTATRPTWPSSSGSATPTAIR